MWEWLIEKAKFPRFVWVALALAFLGLATCVGYRVLTDENVLVKVTDKLEIATQAQKEAIEQREAAHFLLERMNERFDELYLRLDEMKKNAPPEVARKIIVAQTDLSTYRRLLNDTKRPELPRNFPGKPGRFPVHAAKE